MHHQKCGLPDNGICGLLPAILPNSQLLVWLFSLQTGAQHQVHMFKCASSACLNKTNKTLTMEQYWPQWDLHLHGKNEKFHCVPLFMRLARLSLWAILFLHTDDDDILTPTVEHLLKKKYISVLPYNLSVEGNKHWLPTMFSCMESPNMELYIIFLIFFLLYNTWSM